MEVQDTAAGMVKTLHDQGLLSAILTDDQWAAHPGNSVVDQNGNIQVAPRYQLPPYVDINNNMSGVELYVAKATNDKRQLWIDTEEALKRAVIKSLGQVVRQVIRPSKTRFQKMSVAEIIAKVRTRYGEMQKDIKANLREKMRTMLQTADGLDIHISNLDIHISNLDTLILTSISLISKKCSTSATQLASESMKQTKWRFSGKLFAHTL
jgi:hypothetical protein